nr:MAG TPA: Ribbon-helix-helix domain [Caudoviricetes sp.]
MSRHSTRVLLNPASMRQIQAVADAENLTFSQAINTLIQRGFAGKRTRARAAASKKAGSVFSFGDAVKGEMKEATA